MKKRVFSGIKPSGKIHLGNYLGALSQWVKHQNDYENFFCIVDMHALTTTAEETPASIKPQMQRELTRSIAAWYLAIGIDPEKSTIFVQSDNPDHANLAWILNCFTSVGQLNRMHEFKEKSAKQKFISAGLYDYPVLMAADILLYDTDLVPAGEDQKQHIELARDIAQRFNKKYGKIFKIPQYMPPPTGKRIMSLRRPENKMSKSEDDPLGTIDLEDDQDAIRKKIASAITDSDSKGLSQDKPAITNLLTIYLSLTGESKEKVIKRYPGKNYKKFKEDLAEIIIEKLGPLQKKYREMKNPKVLEPILQKGAQRAREISRQKLEKVKRIIGLG